MTTTAARRRWRDGLAGWAIPDHIARAAPTDPHRFDVARFVERATEALDRPHSPTHRTALAALPDGGAVLDVGCGGGAASLPLVPPAARLVGVDQSVGMLAAFADAAVARGAQVDTVEGSWPDAADVTPTADVVVCAHVVYNVAELEPFVRSLTTHARRRVVLELPTRHPLAWTAPYWRDVHGVDRPDGPTADDALEVVAGLGVAVHRHTWRQPHRGATATTDGLVAFLRQRLCLADDRDDELRGLVDRHGVPADREVVTAWWDP